MECSGCKRGRIARQSEIYNTVLAATQLAEISFRSELNLSSSDINDYLIPSLTGYTNMLNSFINQILDTMKKTETNQFASIKGQKDENARKQQQSQLIYTKQTISIIQIRLNTSLTQFCSRLPKIKKNPTTNALIIPRIRLLSQIACAVEACQIYLELQRDLQYNSDTLAPVPPSVAFSTFRAASIREMLNPSNAQYKAKIQDELNQCVANVQNITMLVTY
ncbi:MAG: hypothetical protein EZS28_014885 [Streblomastix strix]|uniref:Uncharacterized protein n=1 Tax=Streblomastix strix TaxID=222440 RepID=A0A5J4W573_9EUKA|nr:MAG: hypothetical protein EZS28_014885 [Streblomastix strix]